MPANNMDKAPTKKNLLEGAGSILVAIVAAGITGAIAWGATQEKVSQNQIGIEKLQQDSTSLEQKIDDLRSGQQQNKQMLERLDERSKGQQQQQEQIIRQLDDIGRRLNSINH